jgi:hypothetical protein
MYLKYYFWALVQVTLLLALPPYLIGLIAGFVRPNSNPKWARLAAVGYILIIEIAVLVEKGVPFLFSNLYFMFSLSPIVLVQYLIGVGGLGLWIVFALNLSTTAHQRAAFFRKASGSNK